MYTANTMASAAEALGMTLPGSSSFPAEYEEKHTECDSIGPVMRNLLEKNILPRDIMTRTAFENAMVSLVECFPACVLTLVGRAQRFSP
jgi:dihydroxy-acid dehydratase